MSRYLKIIGVATILLFGIVSYVGYKWYYTVQHLPEAYAAWDTGTLLVEYMKAHDNRWPKSWDDLILHLNTEVGREIPLRGASPGDVKYARTLHTMVSVDWAFDPETYNKSSPVTRPNGTAFPIVWNGAEPNEMIRAYLNGASAR